MTQFVYGSFGFDVGECAIAGFASTFTRGQTGRPHTLTKSLAVRGRLLRAGMPAVMSALLQRQQALSVNGQPAAMYDNFGNRTPWNLDTASSLGGVIVTKGISNQNVVGAQGVTYLEYDFALEAEYLWAGPNDVLAFSESLEFHDNQGQPLQVNRLPVNGSAIIQNFSQTSFFFCVQSGRMTQAGPNPQPPIATFPGLFIGTPDSNKVVLLPVKTIRGSPVEYGVAWTYQFISTTPFFGGSPNYR